MTKYYCDWCNKEIKDTDSYSQKFYISASLYKNRELNYTVCGDCMEKFVSFIDRQITKED